jgi:hypothetical protein
VILKVASFFKKYKSDKRVASKITRSHFKCLLTYLATKKKKRKKREGVLTFLNGAYASK